MSNQRSSRTWCVVTGFESEGAKTLTESALSFFAKLIIAADKLVKEQASATIDPTLAKKLNTLTEYTRLLVEKFQKTSNETSELRVKQKGGDKLWERVRSELYSTRTLCAQLTETMIFLTSEVHIAKTDKVLFENGLRATFAVLYRLDDRLKSLTSRLISSDKVLRYRIGMTNVIDANSSVTFLRQLDLALMSKSLMVILFHLSWVKDCKYVFTQFVNLADEYQHYHGDKIRFMRVNMKVVRCKSFKIDIIPTVVVIKGDGHEAGRVGIGETIIVPAFIAGLKLILDGCLG